MSHSKKNIAAALAVVLLAATTAYAIDNPDTPSEINQRIGVGDPVAGKDKSASCQGCHGEDGNSVTGAFPQLAGQWSGLPPEANPRVPERSPRQRDHD